MGCKGNAFAAKGNVLADKVCEEERGRKGMNRKGMNRKGGLEPGESGQGIPWEIEAAVEKLNKRNKNI